MHWQKPLKGIWCALCVAVLIWTFISCGQQPDRTLRGECSILAGGIMALLSSPLGLLWVLLLSAAGYGLGVFGIETGSPSIGSDFIVWCGFAAIGFLQWFKLLPWIIARWRLRNTGASGGNSGIASE